MKIVIVGGGISGLSLAYSLLEKEPALDVEVFESDGHPGGKIWTEKVGGYLCEAGVNGFLDNKPATLELSKKINLPPIRSNESARRRGIYFSGKINMIPEKPIAFMKSDFLSLAGRLRMAGEFFVPKAMLEDESMESFAVRRVGREFFEKLLDPMASGVYAGDPAKMSIRSCFAKVYELEKSKGGLIRGFMAMGKSAKKSGKKVEAGPGGTLMSFQQGMYSLVNTLVGFMGKHVRTATAVVAIDRQGDHYTLHCANGKSVETDRVVLATPAHVTATIVKDLAPEMTRLLAEIPYPPVSVVALGFRKEKIKVDTNLFGFLVPGRERRKILGTLFDSSIYPNRAPEGHVLLRTIVGGARAPEIALLDEDRLVETVRAELADMIDLKADPDLVWTYRWERAIPQYNVGHHKRLEKLDEAIARHPGLFLHGNAYRGVAVNDCIGNSDRLAATLASAEGH